MVEDGCTLTKIEPSYAPPALDREWDQVGRCRPDSNILRPRPFALAINHALKEIAIKEHCRPHDTGNRDRLEHPLNLPLPWWRPERGEEGAGSAFPESGAANQNNAEPQIPPRHLCIGRSDRHAPASFPSRQSVSEASYASLALDRESGVERNMTKYQDFARAMREQRGGREWRVQVLPWMVGTCSIIDATTCRTWRLSRSRHPSAFFGDGFGGGLSLYS